MTNQLRWRNDKKMIIFPESLMIISIKFIIYVNIE